MKYIHTKQQEEYDCGIACVASIFKYYNLHHGINYLRDQIGYRNGYSLKDLISLFNQINHFSCKAVEISEQDIRVALKHIDGPCIALINKEVNEYYEGHYIIIYKRKGNKLVISDPSNDKISKITIEEFKKYTTGIFLLIESKNCNSDKKTSYHNNFIKELIRNNKLSISFVLVLSILFVMFSISNSFFFKLLIDEIIPHTYDYLLLQFTLIFLGINFLSNAFDYLRSYIVNKAAIKLDQSISKEFFRKILKLPINFFENRDDGDIISRFNDIYYIRNLVNVAFVSVILNTVIFLGIGFVLYSINILLFFTVLILTLILIAISFMYYDILQKRNKDSMSRNADTQSFLIQFIRNMTNIYSLNKKEYFFSAFNKVFNIELNSTLKESITIINNNGLKRLVQTSFSIILLFVGAKQIMADTISLGDLLFINSLTLFMLNSLTGLIELQGEIQKSLVAKERLTDVINYPVVQNKIQTDITKVKEISIHNLNFNINNHCIIKNVNMNIFDNEKVILIGESGSGKTTFSKLLNKLYQTNSSQIYINGIDINDINDNSLRKEIIYLNETPFLFKDTIKENLCMGEYFTEDEIIKACKIAHIYDVITSLPKGANFVINDSNSNLSTGQKQRLCLARAILHKPSVLILDESLSNVDPDNFIKIYDALLDLNAIVIFITHNPEHITKYDKKFIFKEKSIFEMQKESVKQLN